MPAFVVTAPNGRKFKVNAPEGATKEQALRFAQQQFAQTRRPDAMDKALAADDGVVGSAGDQMLAGAGKMFTDIGLGARQMVGMASGQDAVAKREADARLMAQPHAQAGATGAGLLAAIPALAVPGANTVAGAALTGGFMGAVQPAESGMGRVGNIALGTGLSALGQAGGARAAEFAAQKLSERSLAAGAARSANAVRDARIKQFQDVGYVAPPSAANPSLTNRLLESVSGKAATQQAAAVKNQQTTNAIVRKDLGLAEDAPLTKDTLKQLRDDAGKIYAGISKSGIIKPDAKYFDDLKSLNQSIAQLRKDFPDAKVGGADEIRALTKTLARSKFDASSAIVYMRQLRKDASANLSFLNSADPAKKALGKAQRDAAAALEDAVIRHLEKTGRGKLAAQFDDARRLIAKTYSAEAALNDATGNIVARQLKNQLGRGKPLSGGMKAVAQFAQTFPKAAEEITHSPGVSAVDALVGGVGMTLDPRLLALPLARQVARGGVLSRPYQSRMLTPSYQPRTADMDLLEFAGRSGYPALPAGAFGLLGVEPVEK